MQLLKKILILLIKFSEHILKLTNKHVPTELSNRTIDTFQLVGNSFISKSNRYIFTFFNNLDLRGQDLFIALWFSLNQLDEWNKLEKKIIMISLINPQTCEKFYITKNFVITKETSIYEYWELVEKHFQNFWDLGYIEDTSDYIFISVDVWIPRLK